MCVPLTVLVTWRQEGGTALMAAAARGHAAMAAALVAAGADAAARDKARFCVCVRACCFPLLLLTRGIGPSRQRGATAWDIAGLTPAAAAVRAALPQPQQQPPQGA